MTRAFVSVGSNIERETHIRAAVRELQARFGRLALSAVYESPPVGFAGDNFYNLVAGFDTGLPVEDLVDELHAIERSHGRTRSGRQFESRTIDLDLLLYGNLVRHDDRVDVPRREILDYTFVLQPLAELAPELVHPEANRTLAALWNERRARLAPLPETGFDPLK